MPRPDKRDTGRLVYWLVFTPVRPYLVEASAQDEALPALLRKVRLDRKPWLSRDWRARFATPEEVERYLRLETAKNKSTITQAVKRQRERAHFHEAVPGLDA